MVAAGAPGWNDCLPVPQLWGLQFLSPLQVSRWLFPFLLSTLLFRVSLLPVFRPPAHSGGASLPPFLPHPLSTTLGLAF